MAKKKVNKAYEDFETSGNSNFVQLYWDMLDSDAWWSLKAHDRDLYLYMKRKYFRKVVNGEVTKSNKDNISVTETEIRKCGLMNDRTFWKCIDNLIKAGFIIVVHKGNRFDPIKCNLYEFWTGWKSYPNYKPNPAHMRLPGEL